MRIFKSFLLSAVIASLPLSLSAVTLDEVAEKILSLRTCPAPQSINEQGQLQLKDIMPTTIKSFPERDSTR